MAKMKAVDAAIAIMRKEGVSQVFGVPGAAINPLYAAMKRDGEIAHILARHVEAASHMAEGYTRATPGNIGICIGTSGPAGTDMITGLYSASADSIPILCITGQVPVAKMDKEDFQGVDIAAIARPVTKWAATIQEGAQVPGAFQKAFQIMRSGRQGPVLIDLPFDVQMTDIEFDIDTYEPLPVANPAMTRAQAERVLSLLVKAERPMIISGGGVIISDGASELGELAELLGVPVSPTLMGWGVLPDDHPLNAGMVGIQTSQRYANASFLKSDHILGIGCRWANRHTGDLATYTNGRTFTHIDIEPTQLGRIIDPDVGVVSDAKAALQMLLKVAKEWADEGRLRDLSTWVKDCNARKGTMQRKTHFDNIPIKPQRVFEEMNKAFGKETRYVTTIGLSQIQAAQMLHVYKSRNWINAAQAGPLGWTMPAALGVRAADKESTIVAFSGDYDFHFLIEELAVGAQFNLPYIHVVVNNAYLGLIRQGQRPFNMDYHVQLSYENINSPDVDGYGADLCKVAEGFGCKAIRVKDPNKLAEAFAEAKELEKKYQVPVLVEVIIERVTNISMGAGLDSVTEFEELARTAADAPTAILPIEGEVEV